MALRAQNFGMDRLEARLLRLREILSPHRALLRRIALFAALCGFAAGLYWAFTSVAGLWDRIAFLPLIILLVIGVPVTIVLNAAEFRAMLESAGAQMRWGTALEVTIYTSAANMLPIPGGVLTRLGGMRAQGIGMKQGSWLILLFAGVWAGVAFLISGAAIAMRNGFLGALFLLIGAALLAPSIAGLRRRNASGRLIAKILLIRISLQAVEIARLVLALYAVGTALPFADAAVFAISSFVGTAVSIVPAGLGVNEGMVALLSPVIGLSPAIGFLAAVVNRVVVMAGLVGFASVLLIFLGRSAGRQKNPQPLA